MASGYELVMVAVLAGLKTPTPVVARAGNVRRAHRTALPREAGDAVHLVDGNDEPVGGKHCGQRTGAFTLSLFKRDDAGLSTMDSMKIAVIARVQATSLPAGIVIKPPGRIAPDTETADGDANRLDIEFEFGYPTAGEWSVEYQAP